MIHVVVHLNRPIDLARSTDVIPGPRIGLIATALVSTKGLSTLSAQEHVRQISVAPIAQLNAERSGAPASFVELTLGPGESRLLPYPAKKGGDRRLTYRKRITARVR